MPSFFALENLFFVHFAGNDDAEQPNMFYSVNIGPVHIVAVTTEFFYFTYWGWKQIADQYEWLVKGWVSHLIKEKI